MVLLSAATVSALLNTLGLTQAIFKPIPALVGAVGDVLSGVPIVGSILEADSGQSVPSLSVVKLDASNSSCTVEPYDPSEVVVEPFSPFDPAKATVFRYRQQQSVNLGSWFVHEQWMTPSVFACASNPQIAEIDIASGWNSTTNARTVLERHWDTFINKTDFDYLASIGINTVRLPIGYWTLGPSYCEGTAFSSVAGVYNNSWSRVLRAINWAAEADIGVLIDLHGAPGSQNGQPHSGISDGAVNLFNNATNMDKTTQVLSFLVEQLASVTNVIGIELLNEPANVQGLSEFYAQLIETLRQISPAASNFPLYIHDAFDLNKYSDFVSARTDFVVEDHHSYFVFTPADDAEPANEHTEDVETTISTQLSDASATARGNLIIGEWSCALTPDSLGNATDPDTVRQQFCEGQQQTYANNSAGWSFWSYNKEGCSSDQDWCFINAVGKTLPPTFFSYGNTSSLSPTKLMSNAVAISRLSPPSSQDIVDQAVQTTPNTAQVTSESRSKTYPESSSASPLPSTIARSLQLPHARFSAGLLRRSQSSGQTDNQQGSDTESSASSLNSTETVVAKGYSDGFMTAVIFAQYGMSKLGFKGQYVTDSIEALGPTVVRPGEEYYYAGWFAKGLADGENAVNKSFNATNY